jgi:hypothetical protein
MYLKEPIFAQLFVMPESGDSVAHAGRAMSWRGSARLFQAQRRKAVWGGA